MENDNKDYEEKHEQLKDDEYRYQLACALEEAFEILDHVENYEPRIIEWAERTIDTLELIPKPYQGPSEKIDIYVDYDNNEEKYIRITVAERFGIKNYALSSITNMGGHEGYFVRISDEDAKQLVDGKDKYYIPYIVEFVEVHLGKNRSDPPTPPYEPPKKITIGHIDIYTYDDGNDKKYYIPQSAQERLARIYNLKVGKKLSGRRTVDGTITKNWSIITKNEVDEIYKHEGEEKNNYVYRVIEHTLSKDIEEEEIIDVYPHEPPHQTDNPNLPEYQKLLEEYKKLCEEWKKLYEELKNLRLKYKGQYDEYYIKIIEEFIRKTSEIHKQYNTIITIINLYGIKPNEYIQSPNEIIRDHSFIDFQHDYEDTLKDYEQLYKELLERIKELEADKDAYDREIADLKRRVSELEAQYKMLMNLYNMLLAIGIKGSQQPSHIDVIINQISKDDDKDKSNKIRQKYYNLLEKYKRLYEECQRAVEEMQQKVIECEKGSLSLEEYEKFINKLRSMEVDMKTQYNLLMWLYEMYSSELVGMEPPKEPFMIDYKTPKTKRTGISDDLLETYLQFLEDYKKLYKEYEESKRKLAEKEAAYKVNALSPEEYRKAIDEVLAINSKLGIRYDWLMSLYEKLVPKFKELEVPQKPIPPVYEPEKEEDKKKDKVKVSFLNNGFAIENYSNLLLDKGTIIHPPVIPPEPVNDKNKKKRITFKTFDYWMDQYGRRVDFSKPIEEDLQLTAVYKFDKLKALALGAGAAVGVLAYLADAALMAATSITVPVIAIGGAIGFAIAGIAQGKQLSNLINKNRTVAADVGATDDIPEGLEESVKKEKKMGFWNKFFRNSAIACGIAALIHIIKPPKVNKIDPRIPKDQPREIPKDTPRKIPRDTPREIPREIPRIDPSGTTDVIGEFTGGTPYYSSYDAGNKVNGMQALLDYWKNPTPIEAAYNGKRISISAGQSIDSILRELGANSVDDIGIRIVNGATSENLGWINGADIVAKGVAKAAHLGG